MDMRVLPPMYAAFGGAIVLIADATTELPAPITANAAIIGAFATMVAALVYIVKKQQETIDSQQKSYVETITNLIDRFTKHE